MNLSLLSLECVIPHLDADKRVLLSLCYKSFRKLEERIAIELDELIITQSDIKINDTQYQFGEIKDIRQIEDITEKKRVRIELRNSEGGVGWMSRKDSVLEPGDVELGFCNETFLEAEKHELMQSVRRMFMSALERFIDAKSQYNPLRSFLRNDRIDNVFETIERETEEMVKVCYVDSLLKEVNPVKLERDELSDLYPKAFKRINDSIEVLKNLRDCEMNRDCPVKSNCACSWCQSTISRINKNRHYYEERADILTKLAYPQIIYPHFNQLTVFNDDSQDYHHRLPDGLSLRQAFKQFSTVLFGRRRKIRVRDYRLDGQGIIPLPVGFQIECVKQSELLSAFGKKLLTAFSSTVKYVDRIYLPIYDEQILRVPLIQSCAIFEIHDLESSVPVDAFSDLLNEVLFLKMPSPSDLSPLEFFNEWLKNDNRKIGSKFIIGFHADDVSSISLPTRIFEIGFRETPGSSSYYRRLNGGKKAVLHVDKDVSSLIIQDLDLTWSLDWNYPYLDYCYCVEIVVGSE